MRTDRLRAVQVATSPSWRHGASSAVALMLLLAGLAACGGSDPPETARAETAAAPATQPPPHQRVLARLDRAQHGHFALLRGRPEGLPARTRQVLRVPTAGMNWELAQRLPTTLPGSYWLVPGIRYLCLVSQPPETPGVGTVCAKTAQVLTHGFASISFPDGTPEGQRRRSRLLVGVAPDGAREVLVHTRGTVASAPVVGGVFVLRDGADVPSDYLTLR